MVPIDLPGVHKLTRTFKYYKTETLVCYLLTKRPDKNMLKYIVTVALIATLAATSSAGYIDECSQLATCADCLAHDYCGWCSPYPVVYENGTKGARCGDQRDAPWTCNNLYQTKQCIRGYKCDATNGRCVLAAPGERGYPEKLRSWM